MMTRDLEAAVERALARWLRAHSRLVEVRKELAELEREAKSLEKVEQISQDQVQNFMKTENGRCYESMTFVSGSRILHAGHIGIRLEAAKVLDTRTP